MEQQDTQSYNQPLISPEEAIENLIGEKYLDWLLNYITNQVKNWPQLAQIAQSQPKPEKLRKFLQQRFLAATAFLGSRDGDPGFLGFAIANLSEVSDPLAENALGILEQKRQEELQGESGGHKTHHELWLKLLASLDLPKGEIKNPESKESTRDYIAELSDLYSTGEWQTAMGAFLAHERAIPYEYEVLSKLIKENTSVNAEALQVFSWHAGVDLKYVTNTSHMLEKLMVDPESKRLVFDGVVKQLEARQEFYNSLLKYLV